MKFGITLAAICVALCFICASGDQVHIQKPDEHVHHAKFTLPRKLMNLNVANNMKSLSYKESIPAKKLMEDHSSGNKQQEKEETMMINSGAAAKGTWREWVEEGRPNKSEYFTMDYVWVRRRRPIHNKKIPNLP